MADKTTASEDPSIEEILDSIRQIISEDNALPDEDSDDQDYSFDQEAQIDDVEDFAPPVEEVAPPPPKPAPPPPPVVEDDVFELTEKVEPPSPSIEVDLVDMDDEPIMDEPEEDEPQFEAPPVFAMDEEEDDPDSILTEAAENAAYDAMSTLVRKTAVEHNGITLEDIVRAELKPLLRAWLDKNLPIIIDRLVREELERVSKRALDE